MEDRTLIVLITKLKQYFNSDENARKIVPGHEELISSLEELEAVEGVEEIKKSFVLAVETIITHKINKSKIEMGFHTLLTGPPGVGKTSLANIIAKILISSGAIENNSLGLSFLSDFPKNCVKNLLFSLLFNLFNYRDFTLFNFLGRISAWSLFSTLISMNLFLSVFPNIITKIDYLFDRITSENKINDKFHVVRKEDLIGEYLGQTSVKTKRCLDGALGGVLFIDEAYNLCTDSRDFYGIEALTLINEYMTLHKNEIVIIMSGYSKKIEECLFNIQPGLERRFRWNFNIENYKSNTLASIFEKQANKNGLTIEKNLSITSLFEQNKEKLKNNGGDTEKLTEKCKQLLFEKSFDLILKGEEILTSTITAEILKSAFNLTKIREDSNHNKFMYM